MLLPLLLVIGFDVAVMAPLASWLAGQRQASSRTWFVLGVVVGPFALLALVLTRPAPEPLSAALAERLAALIPATVAAAGSATGRSEREGSPPPVGGPTVEPTPAAASAEEPIRRPAAGGLGAEPVAGPRPAPGARPGSSWTCVPWSRLPVPATADSERAHLARTMAALEAPSALLFDTVPWAAESPLGGTDERPPGKVPASAGPSPDEDRPAATAAAPDPGAAAVPQAGEEVDAAIDEHPPSRSRRRRGQAPAGTSTDQPTPETPARRRGITRSRRQRKGEPAIRLVPPWQAPADETSGRDPKRGSAPHLQALPGRPASDGRPAQGAAGKPAGSGSREDDESTSAICVAVFLGGMPELAIGERYVLEADSASLSISEAGAITRRPHTIRVALAGAELVEFEDRFVITCQPSPGRRVNLAFRGAPSSRIRRRLTAQPQAAGETLMTSAGSERRSARS